MNEAEMDELTQEMLKGISFYGMGTKFSEKLRMPYALMLYPGVVSGDIEFIRKDGSRYMVDYDSVPESFDEFVKENSKAIAFHARVGIPVDPNSPDSPVFMPAVISPGYSPMYDMFLGEKSNCVMLHTVAVPEEQRAHIKEFLEGCVGLVDLLPKTQLENPDSLECNQVLINPAHSLHRTINNMEEEAEYYCIRTAFGFHCLRSIKCCGDCAMLQKAAELLETEALDEQSAAELKALIAEAGIFQGGSHCKGCAHKQCSSEARKVVNYINYLWSEAYTREIKAEAPVE